jgi:exosome complex component RRP41
MHCDIIKHYKLTLLDLNYIEDSAGGPDLPVAILPQFEKVTMMQMDSKLPLDVFEQVVKLATEGCKAVHEILKQAVGEYTLGLLDSRGL